MDKKPGHTDLSIDMAHDFDNLLDLCLDNLLHLHNNILIDDLRSPLA